MAARHTAIPPISAVLGWVSRCSPDWLGVALAGVVLDLVGEVCDELGSLC